ncbi:hypothetical protein E2P81_ATG00825 [Venturia nashicola]|nr:hypothetical protein E2P81_ATG00825 [Venturia nashicola]
MDPMKLSTFNENKMLVRLLFPADFAGHGELNQDAVSHQPSRFPVARGQAKIKHPTHAMPSKLFERIEQFFLCPDTSSFWTKATAGQMRDSGDAMDEDMDDDAGSLELGEEEDIQAEEDEDRSDMQIYETKCGLEDHSMDLLTQDIKHVELREGLDEDLSHVAGRLHEIVLDLEKGMNCVTNGLKKIRPVTKL